MLTQEYLLSIFDYEPETGALVSKVDIKTGRYNNVVKRSAGNVAGGLRPDGYRTISVEGKRYYAHRIIWLMVYGVMPKYIDHINLNRSDNRLVNLRACTQSENSCNAKIPRHNSSGFKHVQWNKYVNKWMVVIRKDNKIYNGGYYADINDADRKAHELRDHLHRGFANS